jgi:hypothetical protein
MLPCGAFSRPVKRMEADEGWETDEERILVACRGEFVSMLRGGGVGQSTSIEMVGRSWSKRECSG